MESRLVDLEVRYMHLEREVAALSQVVFEQQKMIDYLKKELSATRGKVDSMGDPTDERPAAALLTSAVATLQQFDVVGQDPHAFIQDDIVDLAGVVARPGSDEDAEGDADDGFSRRPCPRPCRA